MSNLLKPISKSPGGGGSLKIPGLGKKSTLNLKKKISLLTILNPKTIHFY